MRRREVYVWEGDRRGLRLEKISRDPFRKRWRWRDVLRIPARLWRALRELGQGD